MKNSKAAKAVKDAIYIEMISPPVNERSRITKVNLTDKSVFVEIEAEDLTALRASTDSKMRWLYAISSCLDTLDKTV